CGAAAARPGPRRLTRTPGRSGVQTLPGRAASGACSRRIPSGLTPPKIVPIMQEMPRVRSKSEGHALAMALRRAYLLMHRRVDARFGEAGVRADQLVVLNALTEATSLPQRELADRIACNQNPLRAMLLPLEKKPLIQRSPPPPDGRARLVSLTPEGERLQQT